MVRQIPKKLSAFRCGFAGKPQDSATNAVTYKEGNFASRFANYLNYWLPTDGKVHAKSGVFLRVVKSVEFSNIEAIMKLCSEDSFG